MTLAEIRQRLAVAKEAREKRRVERRRLEVRKAFLAQVPLEQVQALRLLCPNQERLGLFRKLDDKRWGWVNDSREARIARKATANWEMTFDWQLRSHLLGYSYVGAVGADVDGITTVVGVDLDKHTASQHPRRVAEKFLAAAHAWDVPVIVHSSKSGMGFHIRTLLVPMKVALARALYIQLAIVAGVLAEKAFDKVWPPSRGTGILALPWHPWAGQRNGGGLAMDSRTLDLLMPEDQAAVVLDSPRMSEQDMFLTLSSMGVNTEPEIEKLAGCSIRDSFQRSTCEEGRDPDIAVLMSHCLAAQRLECEIDTVDYRFWWAMMSNFKLFDQGRETFEAISMRDSARYRPRALDSMWKSTNRNAGPVRCENLSHEWRCPLLGQCGKTESLEGVRAPVALPRRLRRLGLVGRDDLVGCEETV
jgi:hypothetical protein